MMAIEGVPTFDGHLAPEPPSPGKALGVLALFPPIVLGGPWHPGFCSGHFWFAVDHDIAQPIPQLWISLCGSGVYAVEFMGVA